MFYLVFFAAEKPFLFMRDWLAWFFDNLGLVLFCLFWIAFFGYIGILIYSVIRSPKNNSNPYSNRANRNPISTNNDFDFDE